jgi:O-antigen/teichoic acid export membrane protein
MLEELRRLLKHSTIFGLGNVLGKLIGFFMIPFYTHFLVPREYGTLELLDLAVGVVGLILSVWITGPVLRYYYDYEEQSDRNSVISTALIGAIVIAGVAAAICYSLAPAIAGLVLKSRGEFYYVRIASLSVFFSCCSMVGWSYLRAKQQSAILVTLDLSVLVIALSLNIYLIAFLHFGVGGMLIGSLMGATCSTGYIAVRTFREVGFSFSWHKFVTLVAFGAPLFFNSAAAFVLNFSDRFFLQHFTDTATVGIYALGYKFGYMLSILIVQPFMIIWGARAYEIAKQERGREYFGRIVEYFGLVLVTAALGLSLIIRQVIHIIAAPTFQNAHRIVPLVAVAYIFQGLALYFQTGLMIEKKSGLVGAVGLASIATNITLNFVLISRYGAIGAALATAVTFAFQAILTFIVLRRVYLSKYRIWRLAAPVLAAATIYLASTRININALSASLMLRLGLFLLFPVLLFACRFFDPAEIDGMRTLAKSILQRTRLRAAAAPNG